VPHTLTLCVCLPRAHADWQERQTNPHAQHKPSFSCAVLVLWIGERPLAPLLPPLLDSKLCGVTNLVEAGGDQKASWGNACACACACMHGAPVHASMRHAGACSAPAPAAVRACHANHHHTSLQHVMSDSHTWVLSLHPCACRPCSLNKAPSAACTCTCRPCSLNKAPSAATGSTRRFSRPVSPRQIGK
jgi:hypothetical protein